MVRSKLHIIWRRTKQQLIKFEFSIEQIYDNLEALQLCIQLFPIMLIADLLIADLLIADLLIADSLINY